MSASVPTAPVAKDDPLMEYSILNPPKDTSQHTFMGRFMHFQRVVDPRNFFMTSSQLKEAITYLENIRQRERENRGPLLVKRSEHEKITKF